MAAGTLLLPLFPGKAWTISTNVSVDSNYTKKSMFSVDRNDQLHIIPPFSLFFH